MKGKRQNQLTDEHIAKIVDTYQFRKVEDRYSKRVAMEEIATNDYNLNISRYVSTAQQETEIDLAATHEELVQIENAITRKRKNPARLVSQGSPLTGRLLRSVADSLAPRSKPSS